MDRLRTTTTDNWLDDPYPSRAFQRVREFAPTARVANDSGVVQALPVELRDLGGVEVEAADGGTTTVDRQFDAKNPRTAIREIPSGQIGLNTARGITLAAAVVFVALSFALNEVCGYLSPVALGVVCGYSYAKRFTMLAHVWLGAALGMAPVAAWIAIRGEALLANPADGLPALILGLAVTTWVAGFDIIYACQDAGFDESQGLHSIPARLGVPRALTLAAGLHVVTLAILATLPLVVPQLGAVYWGTLVAIAALLVWEHSLVRPDDLSRVNQAFFTANAAIGLLLLVAIAIDCSV
jgi:4-hydroxybenzoate polyprenyltransferase